MVELKDIAKKIENILNTNTLGKTFRIFSDSGELAKRNGHENEYRNGLVEIVSSTISNLSGLEFINTSVNLTLYANEEARGKDSDGNSLEIIELRQILGDFLDSYNFKTFAEEFGEATYSTTYVIGATTTLPKGSLGYINDCVPLVTNIGLTFFENGVNSNEWQIFIDGEEVGYTSAVISRTKTAENQPLVESKSTKSVMQTNGFGLDLVVPQISNNLGKAIENEILTGQEYAHMLYVKGKNTEQNYICVFGNLQASLIKNANVGFNVSLVEGVPELLDYKDSFTTDEYNAKYGDFSFVEITNQNEDDLIIYFGDGAFIETSEEVITHKYSTSDQYFIAVFNKNGNTVTIDTLEDIKGGEISYNSNGNEITLNSLLVDKKYFCIPSKINIGGIEYVISSVGNGTSKISTINKIVYIEDGIKTLNKDAFNSPQLTEIRLPETLESIGDYCFRNSQLESIYIPDSVTILGNNILNLCGYLKNVSIGAGVSSITYRTINNTRANNIESITISENNETYKNDSENRAILSKNGTNLVYYTANGVNSDYSTPTGVTSIGEHAFEYSVVENIIIGNGVESIGNNAFIFSEALKTIFLPNTLTSIEGYAFYGCDNLTSITIPSGVTSIGNYAFSQSDKLVEVTMAPEVPPALGGGSVFDNSGITTTVGKIYVPSASLSAYQAAYRWSAYADKMVGV